jgi:hypothetical protein
MDLILQKYQLHLAPATVKHPEHITYAYKPTTKSKMKKKTKDPPTMIKTL